MPSPDDILGEILWDLPEPIGDNEGKPSKLTRQQRNWAMTMFSDGYVFYTSNLRTAQRNKCLWRLVALGLADFRFGPSGSWLKTYCFMPLWTDPIC